MAITGVNTQATPPDPNSSQAGGGRMGGSGDRFRRGEFATVIEYQSDRYTATVRTERGRTLHGVPRVRSTPGEIAPLTTGCEVLLNYDYAIPVIIGVLSMPASGNDGSSQYSVSNTVGTTFNESTITTVGNFRGASEPTDVTPGDWTQLESQSGALFALLTGGTAVMKSSTLAQVRTHLINDVVEIISRNYRHITDMGEFTIYNDDGRITMSFRGASDQRTEAGPDEQKWTIKMDLGAEGDMFNFEICTTEGQTLFRFHVTAEGALELFGINGLALNSGARNGGSHAENHTGDSVVGVGGDRTATTQGAQTTTVYGTDTETVGGDKSVNVCNDYMLQAIRDLSLSAGRNATVSVQGDSTSPGGDALTFDLAGGNYVVNIGSAASQLGSYLVNTQSGAMTFSSQLGGDFNVNTQLGNVVTTSQTAKIKTSLPDSVVLGGDSLASHVVKFEELRTHLINLYTALDSHIHPAPGGATSPPLVPIGAPLVGSIETFQSIKVGVDS